MPEAATGNDQRRHSSTQEERSCTVIKQTITSHTGRSRDPSRLPSSSFAYISIQSFWSYQRMALPAAWTGIYSAIKPAQANLVRTQSSIQSFTYIERFHYLFHHNSHT